MKVVVAGYGGRGDVEPCVAAGRELLRRGHDVQMAVPPNMLGLIESAGLAGVALGPDSREEMNPGSDLVRSIMPKIKNPLSVVPDVVEHVTQVKLGKSATLRALADGADLMLAGFNEQGVEWDLAYSIPDAGMISKMRHRIQRSLLRDFFLSGIELPAAHVEIHQPATPRNIEQTTEIVFLRLIDLFCTLNEIELRKICDQMKPCLLVTGHAAQARS